MWNIDYEKRAAETLGLSKDETREFSKRYHYHLKKNGFSKEEILKGIFILNDILQRKENLKKVQSVPDFGFKNKGILKYKIKIVNLFHDGNSTREIEKALKKYPNSPSRSTIQRYLSVYKDYLEGSCDV